ncbi:cysteine-rich with EGF-like domain protein 2-B [Danaus plexippus]|uniref:cysteine-rich with EGF-like domain protein 2-B n=1 Tax=Danaus plexippus TaxID=13037 RepID=UPI002AB02087|nr:cysteine-rich with EGF-like domain protein 2-B [Danaus plexippus]
MLSASIAKLTSIYLIFFMIPALVSLKKSGTGKVNKLNDCMRCVILKDSINNWLEKTSRSNHEGGDVAWEEAKLKSYSRSEMRLVEIQEKLCTEVKKHQDQCYALAEEAEQLLEQWWFEEDHDVLDLYTWLCINHLKLCCPSGHFGVNCEPCLLDKNNKICGGNGECSGDGTRHGNGTCICNKGFAGSNCDECSKNYFLTESSCKPCHPACKECHRFGRDACMECAAGWKNELGVCVDVNECLDSPCNSNEFCVNREGSFKCTACDNTCETCLGPGPKNCSSCKANNHLWLGRCMNRFEKNNILKEALMRISLYIFWLLVTFLFYKKSAALASLTIILLSTFIFYYEKYFETNLLDIIYSFI